MIKKRKKRTAVSDDAQAVKKIAVVGQPNTGKSLVFNILTNDYALVGNYPLTTVEMKKSRCEINGRPYEVTDTPGLHCLYIHSREELQVRNMIFSERPDVIVQCIDANCLKQSLTLTADLLELGIPMVIALNAIDETSRKGVWIDSVGLSRLLGVPVVELVATHGRGGRELKDAIAGARPGKGRVPYGETIETGVATIASALPEDLGFKRKIAALLLLGDPFLADRLKKEHPEEHARRAIETADRIRRQIRANVARLMNNARSRWIDDIVEKIVRKQKVAPGQTSRVISHLCRHPVFGIPIFLGIILIMYLLVVNVANTVAGWMNDTLWLPIEELLRDLVPEGFWCDFLIGDYGVLSLGLANAFLTVLPILSVFFLAFNTLEDIGYIPNLCVLTKRITEKLGLSGSAIMSLVLGFGCKTMATLTTKSLRSKKEQYIAIYLIAFAIPCAAQLALNMSILGRMGLRAFVLAFSVLAGVEIAAGLALNRILKEEHKDDFIQELPPMRLPGIKAVLKKTYYRMLWFIREAVPVFLYAAVILFVIDRIGILGATKTLLKPIVGGWLGLPIQMVDALILCMARHEAAAGLIIRLIENGLLDYRQCIVAVTITTMFVPCFANIMAMIKELGSRTALSMAVLVNTSSFLIAGSLNWSLVLLNQ